MLVVTEQPDQVRTVRGDQNSFRRTCTLHFLYWSDFGLHRWTTQKQRYLVFLRLRGLEFLVFFFCIIYQIILCCQMLAKTKPTKLEFRAQSILNFNFHFSRWPLFLFTCPWNLPISQLDKFINFSRSYTRLNLLRLTCRFYRPVFTSTTCHFDQVGSLLLFDQVGFLDQVGSI